MKRWSAVAVALAAVLIACGDSDRADPAAAAATSRATVTATSMPTPTATPAQTAVTTITPAPTASPGGGPTLAQLRQGRLALGDLEESRWFDINAGQLERRYSAVFAVFVDFNTDAILRTELHDARNGVPDFLALGLLDGTNPNHLTWTAPLGLGANEIRYRYSYDEDGERWYGEVMAWRQGGVVVAMQAEDLEPNACVCGYAKLQYDKLAATIR